MINHNQEIKSDKEVIESVCEIDKQIKNEISSENPDDKLLTKLYFEQMLRGLNLTQEMRGMAF